MGHKNKSVSNLYKWVSPGIFVKRWLITSLLGVLLTVLGFAIWVKLTPINRLIELVIDFLNKFTSTVPNYVTGPVAITLGLFLLYWGQHRTFSSIQDAFQLDSQQQLVDVLWDHHRLNRGIKIVALGGGTGLSTMLRGLKEYSSNITAVVTVADDGGSSGVLRRELGALPPGDIRNCIAALANEEKLLTELFQYRFNSGEGLKGHSFGNLFLTAMSDITKDPETGIHASSQVLAIKGRVLPATLDNVTLWAKFADGVLVEGESSIAERGGKIIEFGCKPSSPQALPSVLEAIRQAEFIVMGPGSLYTSVIPNLLVPEIRQAILSSKAPKIYVCNIMTQPGETDNYTVADHIRAIDEVCGAKLFDGVLVQGRPPSPLALRKYADEYSHPVFLDRQEVINLGRRIVISNVMSEDLDTHIIRHNPRLLARALMRWVKRK
ncbi:MAG: YvcK family protein [Cyanobacterium sp. T60_A2020_053]|nr:YvcK family protein [Cyanobacterium sp. T60_A2020_053]